ncbi:MAG: hypothetical protein R3208_07095 [Ketobacteraceae bacterium]|nr:hypothetical protein [Ketobacteraceae bacterium]
MPLSATNPDTPVVVLVHGDGQPVDYRGRLLAIPVPSTLLMVSANSIPFPWILIGRPCYFDTADPQCHPRWWTVDRYHQQTAQSLSAVMRRIVPESTPVILVAYSGGAALAHYLVHRHSNVVGFVSIAGNFDVPAWTRFHGFTPMGPGVINSVAEPVLPCRVKQVHFAGAKDRNIPAAWIGHYVQRQTVEGCALVTFNEISQATHTQGWERWWQWVPWEAFGRPGPPENHIDQNRSVTSPLASPD